MMCMLTRGRYESLKALGCVSLALLAISGCSESESDMAGAETMASNKRIGEVPDSGGFTKERVFFATNRERDFDSEDPNTYFTTDLSNVSMGWCEVSVPYTHKIGSLEEPSLLRLELREDPAKHIVLLQIDLAADSAVESEISKAVAESEEKQALVFIHGYQNSFRDAARRTAQLSHDLNFDGPAIFFSWPAGRVNYLADLRCAEESIDECAAFIKTIATQCGVKRLNIIAHSMGNFVLSKALEQIANSPEADATMKSLKQIALAAPDINGETFPESVAPAIRDLADRFTVYAASNDAAMLASREANGWDPLGDVNPISSRAGLLSYVDYIDATAVSKDSWFSIGHAYYGDMPELIRDLKELLQGEPAAKRGLRREASTYLLKP